jgi:hypothetical protein
VAVLSVHVLRTHVLIKSRPSQDHKNEGEAWLMYWVVYAFLSQLEPAADRLLSWLP